MPQFTIASGATDSDLKPTLGEAPVAIITPAAITGTAISFKVGFAPDGSDLKPYHKEDGSLYSVTIAAARATMVLPDTANGISAFHFFKIVSNGAEGAARSVEVRTQRF